MFVNTGQQKNFSACVLMPYYSNSSTRIFNLKFLCSASTLSLYKTKHVISSSRFIRETGALMSCTQKQNFNLYTCRIMSNYM